MRYKGESFFHNESWGLCNDKRKTNQCHDDVTRSDVLGLCFGVKLCESNSLAAVNGSHHSTVARPLIKVNTETAWHMLDGFRTKERERGKQMEGKRKNGKLAKILSLFYSVISEITILVC